MTAIIVILAILILLIALYMFCVKPGNRPLPAELATHYAHRGLHGDGIPENSLEAFARAADAGYGIELDVQLSKDGEIMVFHDYPLTRMTGARGKLSEKTAEELRALRLAETESVIPTLKEVLDLVDGRIPLLIELKGESGDKALCVALDALMKTYKGPYLIESFNPLLLAWYKKNAPDVLRGQLTTKITVEQERTARNMLLDTLLLNVITRPDFLAYDLRYAGRLPVRLCTELFHAHRFTWTIRGEEDYRMSKARRAWTIFEGYMVPKE